MVSAESSDETSATYDCGELDAGWDNTRGTPIKLKTRGFNRPEVEMPVPGSEETSTLPGASTVFAVNQWVGDEGLLMRHSKMLSKMLQMLN